MFDLLEKVKGIWSESQGKPPNKLHRGESEAIFKRYYLCDWRNAVLDGQGHAEFCTVSLLQIQFPSFKFSALVDVEGKHI